MKHFNPHTRGFALLQILPIMAVMFMVVTAISTINLASLKRVKNENSREYLEQLISEVSTNLLKDCNGVLGGLVVAADGNINIASLPLPNSGASTEGILKKPSLDVNDQFTGFRISSIDVFFNQDPEFRYGVRGVATGWLSITVQFDASSLQGTPTATRFIPITLDPQAPPPADPAQRTINTCSLPGTVEDLCLMVGLPIDAGTNDMPRCSMPRVNMIIAMAVCYNICRYSVTQPFGAPTNCAASPDDLDPIPALASAEVNALIDGVNFSTGNYGGLYTVPQETVAIPPKLFVGCNPTDFFSFWTANPALRANFDSLF